MISSLDNYVMHLTGAIAGRHAFLDKFITKFLQLHSVKLLPLMAILIYLWFREDDGESARNTAVEAVTSMFVAVVVSRSVQNLSPLRLRPLHAGNPAFVAPIGIDTEMLEHWSSFPSDNAALSFALSTALWRFSRPLGALAYAWSALIVCLPRIYAGYHYISDVLGGAIIGITAVLCLRLFFPIKRTTDRLSNVAAHYPGLFNTGLFTLMFFFATTFDDIRKAAHGMFK